MNSSCKACTMLKYGAPAMLFLLLSILATILAVWAKNQLPKTKNFEIFEDSSVDLDTSGSENVLIGEEDSSTVNRRMGVLEGPPVVNQPARVVVRGRGSSRKTYFNRNVQQSKGTVVLPLAAQSPYNLFSIQDGSGILAEDRKLVEESNELRITSFHDLNLKLRALETAQKTSGVPDQKILENGTTKCESFISTENFFIRSPNYPYNYPPNITCDYNIYRRVGSCGVELTVLRFDLAPPDEVSGYCKDNFTVASRPFCGRRLRGETALIPFPGLLLPLRLESGHDEGASGVLLQGRQVSDCRKSRQLGRSLTPSKQCSRSYGGEKFQLRSPEYPNDYPNNAECRYTVTRRSDEYCGIILTIGEFSLEPASCMYDYIEVNRQRICGSKPKGSKYYFHFVDDKIQIRFRSDESVNSKGFQIPVTQVKCDEVSDVINKEHQNPKTLHDFLAVAARRQNLTISTASSGEYQQTNFQDDDDISYLLSLAEKVHKNPTSKIPSLEFQGREITPEVDLEALYEANDMELITENEGNNLAELTTTLANLDSLVPTEPEPTPQVTTGLLLPTLPLNSSVSNLGPCDQVHEEESFILEGPKNTGKIDCTYLIKRASDHVCEIRILLTSLELERRNRNGNCGREYVQVAGTRFCGGDENRQVGIKPANSFVSITYHADRATSDTGFKAYVEQIKGDACYPGVSQSVSADDCDVTVDNEVATIYSPHYPSAYPDNTHCVIRIRKVDPQIRSITLRLQEFGLEESQSCHKDYLNVGGAKLCGQRSGQSLNYRFPGDELVLEFHSDFAEGGVGYKIELRQNRQLHASGPFTTSGPLVPKPGNVALLFPATSKPPTVLGSHGTFKPVPFPPNPSVLPPATSVQGRPFATSPPVAVPESAKELPTMKECGESSNQLSVVLRSPGFPAALPKLLNCQYIIHKFSSEICQLKLIIHHMSLGKADQCADTFLQIGAQQRICGTKNSETRTYHFTEDSIQIVLQTDDEKTYGGFDIIIEQLPCGHFEPIGTFTNSQGGSGVQIVTGRPLGSIDSSLSSTSVTKPTSSSSSGVSHEVSWHGYGTISTISPTSVPPKTPSYSSNHFLYYYIPGQIFQRPNRRPQQSQQTKGQTKGQNSMLSEIMRSKYAKWQSLISNKQNTRTKGSVEVETEYPCGQVQTLRPKTTTTKPAAYISPCRHSRRPKPKSTTAAPAQFTSNRPLRYKVRNPYYRPQENGKVKQQPTIRIRYPQAYSQNYGHLRSSNGFFLIPTGQAQEIHGTIFFSNPSTSLANQFSSTYQAPNIHTSSKPHSVNRPTPIRTQRPVIRLPSSRRPFTTAGSNISPNNRPLRFRPRNPTISARPVIGYQGFIVANTNAGSSTQKYLVDGPHALPTGKDLSSATQALDDCGTVIRDEEFYIRSPQSISPNSIIHDDDDIMCTYTIAKSSSDRCSVVLEVFEYEQLAPCKPTADRRCSPTANMVTSFASNEEMLLTFNRSRRADDGSVRFTLHGVQQACKASSSSKSDIEQKNSFPQTTPPQQLGKQLVFQAQQRNASNTTTQPQWRETFDRTSPTETAGDEGNTMNTIPWVGPGGRGTRARQVIENGALAVNIVKQAEKKTFTGKNYVQN